MHKLFGNSIECLLVAIFCFFTGDAVASMKIVFDGSISMCGFFSHEKVDPNMINLLSTAISMSDQEKEVSFAVLNQKNKNGSNIATDIVPVQSDFFERVLAIKSTWREKKCEPLNGIGSDLSSIFNLKTDTLFLITDALFWHKDRERFGKIYSNWLSAGGDVVPYSGFSLINMSYAGNYYPSASHANDSTRHSPRQEVDFHSRPLLVFWFARNDKHLTQINKMLASLGNWEVQHQWLPKMDELVKSAGKVKSENPFETDLTKLLRRNDGVMRLPLDQERRYPLRKNCLKFDIVNNQINFWGWKRCGDNNSLFDGLTSIPVIFDSSGELNFIEPTTIILTRANIGTVEKFGIKRKNIFSEPNVSGFNLYRDECDVPRRNKATCAAFLASKTFGLNFLIKDLTNRSKNFIEEKTKIVEAQEYKYTLKLRENR